MLCLRQTPRTAIHLRANCILLTRLRVTSPPQCLFVPHSSLPSSATSLVITIPTRPSSSSTRWKSRQTNDHFAKSARVAGLKSRAAYKLLELDAKHRLFRKGGTVVDLGYAPGSWSQVAVNRTAPGGRVVGIDVIPAQPPRGASSIQGNFLSAEVQEEVRSYVRDYWKGRARRRGVLARRVAEGEEDEEQGQEHDNEDEEEEGVSEDEVEGLSRGIVELGRESSASALASASTAQSGTNLAAHGDIAGEEANAEPEKPLNQAEKDDRDGRVVDVVLSDMSAPWEQITGTWIKSVNNPYHRMMNTSGMPFRDHAGSMVRTENNIISLPFAPTQSTDSKLLLYLL